MTTIAMASSHSGSTNPCVVGSEHKIATETKEDYIQIDLNGNDTTLYIRETSIEDLKYVKEGKPDSTADSTIGVPSSVELSSPLPDEVRRTNTKTEKAIECDTFDNKSARNKQLDQLYFKKWTGKTYFEEELRLIRNMEYKRNLEEALKKRNLWKVFQKDIAKERKRDLIRTSGPEWWQEPSNKQICLATSLGDVITTDYEEGVTGRTRQWLLDLGVTTRVSPAQVRGCMKRSLLNPIDFLLETHGVVLKSQLNIKKKRGDLERPFSVDERLLLSAVCVLHLPTLLTILHYILPPPKPYSTEKHIQELLFGDLDDERVRYSTPYMEPLPFRNQYHFINWAVDNVFRALLPSVITMQNLDGNKIDSLSVAIPSMKMSVMSQQRPTLSEKRTYTSRFSESSATADSITWLIAQCISKRQITASLYPFCDSVDGTPKFYNRHLTNKSFSKQIAQSVVEGQEQDFDEKTSDFQSINDSQSGKDINLENLLKTMTSNTNTLSNSNLKTLTVRGSGHNPGESKKSQETKFGQVDISEEQLFTEKHYSQGQISQPSQTRSTYENTQNPEQSSDKNEVSEKDIDSKKIREIFEQEGSEMQKLWVEIAALPENEQLKRALDVLREMGDPLARLPKVHKIPTVLRWLELRRGKNRILSKDAKAELLRRSRGMWKMAPVGNTFEGPSVKCSKRVERLLTWDKKKWLGVEVDKAVNKYYSRVKQEKVDNARTFFPTMLNHYDHGSKLVRNFREVFFTYMPAREADTFVYRPWQPQETKNSKSM